MSQKSQYDIATEGAWPFFTPHVVFCSREQSEDEEWNGKPDLRRWNIRTENRHAGLALDFFNVWVVNIEYF